MMATHVCVDCYHFSVYLVFPTTFTEEYGIQFHAFYCVSPLWNWVAFKVAPDTN